MSADLSTFPDSNPITATSFSTDTSSATLSLREQILSAQDITTEEIAVPEWGVTLSVRTMTGAARAEMLASASDPETGEINYKVLYPQVIVASCIDPATGAAVFSPSDVDALNQKSAAALERVAQAGMRVSGMTGDSEKSLGNDSSAQSGDSTSS